MPGRVDDYILAIFGELWYDSSIYKDVATIADDYGHRFMGTASEREARDYILRRFQEVGLEGVHLEPFRYIGWERGSCQVEMVAPKVRPIPAISMVHAPSTPPGGLELELVDVGMGTEEDFRRVGDAVKGRLVLADSSQPLGQIIHRTTKYGRAVRAGAAAFAFASASQGQLYSTGTIAPGYRKAGEIPAIGLTYETAAFLRRMLERGPVRLRLQIENKLTPDTESWNIVGELPGSDPEAGFIIVGAHYDGHDLAQGAGDNALGVATIIDVARALRRVRGRLRKTIRFIAFGVEESWTCGSTNYVDQHLDELKACHLMINADGVGRFGTPRVNVWYPPELVDVLKAVFASRRLPVTVARANWHPGTSDYWPFVMEGVPAVDLLGERPPASMQEGRGNIDHTQADTVDKLDPIRIREGALSLAALLLDVADRPGPLVRHTPKEEFLKVLEETGLAEELRLQGRWHPESVLGR